jgi:hypothetical protein
LLILGLVCTIGLSTTGCKKKEEPTKGDKAPSTGDKGAGEGGKVAVIEYNIFPTKVIILKQGEKQEVPIERKGKDLKDLKLELSSSDEKVKATGGEFKGEEKGATITIHAEKDAPAKEHTITVKAGDVEKKIDVKVEPAEKGKGDAEKGKGDAEKGKGDAEKGKGKGDAEKGKGKGDKGALNFRPQRDAYVALGREELQAAPSLTRRQAVWFIRES